MESEGPKLQRKLTLLNATSINMSNMVGIGPFITFPLIVGAMGGPQAMLGWVVGAVLAIMDGFVLSELGAALPGSGGAYIFLREGYGPARWGRLMSFLFIWQFIWSGPLEIASGNIGFVQYLSFLKKDLTPTEMKFMAAGVGVLAIILLYRKITDIAKLMLALWIGMLVTVGWVIVTGLVKFDATRAFSFPPGAFAADRNFFVGLGAASVYVMYCFLGYNQACSLGDEVLDPPRTIPRAVILSVLGVFAIDLLMNLVLLGVVPYGEVIRSPYPVSEMMARVYGPWAGVLLSLMVLWTAFASIFALLLGYSRIPYAAALDGNFFRPFAKLHSHGFPHISLLVVGGMAVLASFFNLATVINALMAARILIQFVGQIFAVALLRIYRPEVRRPFKMWLYPLPSLVAFAGWIYVFVSTGARYIFYGAGVMVTGVIVYLVVAHRRKVWPFPAPATRPGLAAE